MYVMEGKTGYQEHRLVPLPYNGNQRILDADGGFVSARWPKQVVFNIFDGHRRASETKRLILVEHTSRLQRFGIVARQSRKQQTYLLCLGEIVQLSQREMRCGVESVDIGKPQDDVVDLLRARPDARPNPIEKSDRCPEENKSLDLEGDDPPPGLTQKLVRAERAFDI